MLIRSLLSPDSLGFLAQSFNQPALWDVFLPKIGLRGVAEPHPPLTG
jgi:hypothetical protein